MTSSLSVVAHAPPFELLSFRQTCVAHGATVLRMSEQISQRELRNDSARIMRALDEGNSFVITRNGTPVGELRPLRRHRFVAAGTVIDVFRDAPRVDAPALRRDLDELIDQAIPDRA